jgi:hypothetical protein
LAVLNGDRRASSRTPGWNLSRVVWPARKAKVVNISSRRPDGDAGMAPVDVYGYAVRISRG